MFQLYLLTVITTVLAGLALSREFLSERFSHTVEYTNFMTNGIYRIVLAVVSILIAIINFFDTYPGDIIILGELFPSLAGLIAGVLLLVEYWNGSQKKNEESKTAELAGKVEQFSGPYIVIVGIVSIIIGILHAILPKFPLL